MAQDPDPPPGTDAAVIPGGAETTFRLLERVRAGDQAALEALFARYLMPLRRWASGRLPRHVRDAADTQDLVQETLLQTFKRMGLLQTEWVISTDFRLDPAYTSGL